VPLFVRRQKPGPLKPKANPYPSRFYRWRNSLCVTFVFILIVGGGLRFYKPFADTVEEGLFEGTAWIQGVFIRPFYETRDVLKDTYVFMHLKEDHAQLKQENEKLRLQVQALLPLQAENAALKKNLKVAEFETHGHLSTRVLASPYDGIHHFFLIGAGRKDGLQKDQAVIAFEGVVGRLEKVGQHISRVLLLTDSSSRIPVKTLDSDQKAILAGEGTFFPTLVYVNDTHKVHVGEKVVTTGVGGIFPPGLPVGIVDEIVNGKIKIRPYVPLQSLEWAFVLRALPEGFVDEFNRIVEGE